VEAPKSSETGELPEGLNAQEGKGSEPSQDGNGHTETVEQTAEVPAKAEKPRKKDKSGGDWRQLPTLQTCKTLKGLRTRGKRVASLLADNGLWKMAIP